ncbi:MAG: hypothetical protein H8E31_08380 [Planctomycetes bacterium]|nr:hypothetical protein [Planctomycetota bacterium]
MPSRFNWKGEVDGAYQRFPTAAAAGLYVLSRIYASKPAPGRKPPPGAIFVGKNDYTAATIRPTLDQSGRVLVSWNDKPVEGFPPTQWQKAKNELTNTLGARAIWSE